MTTEAESGRTRRLSRPRSRALVRFAIVVLVASSAVLTFFPLGFVLSAPAYLIVVVALGALYTVLPFVRDSPGPLLAWPPVVLLLTGVALFALFGVVDLSWIGPLALAATFCVLLSILLLAKGIMRDLGREPLSFIHPLFLKSMLDTRPTRDDPVPFMMSLDSSMFPMWIRLGRFLRRERLADFVRIGRRSVTVRWARIMGLSRIGALVLLPFGETAIRVDSQGSIRVSFDKHTYRLLDRPGPYELYCRNLVGFLQEMAMRVVEGKVAEARQITVVRGLT